MPIKLINDGPIDIATGLSREQVSWKNKQWQWSELVNKISQTTVTHETYKEYLAAKREVQDKIKDVGGFIGGYLANGRRKANSVVHRQLLTLDMDYGKKDLWDDFTMFFDWAAAIYSTHKHSPENPRYRLVIPIDREVSPDEFKAISRRVADSLGIDYFDHSTSFKPSQIMYWPSTAKDGVFSFEYQDGPWLNADIVLATYHDWTDSSSWPMSSREQGALSSTVAIKTQKDPLLKDKAIGAFCRTYDIHQAIELFLSDVYEPCDIPDRYSFKNGSTTAGVVTYEDKFSFSHHGTDPTSGKLCNAYDLVRLHLFGLSDEGNSQKNSTYSMRELIKNDKKVMQELAAARFNSAKADFEHAEPEDKDVDAPEQKTDDTWTGDLEVDERMNYLSTRNNFRLVLQNDPKLKDRFAFDEFSKRTIVTKNLPWRKVKDDNALLSDADIANLRIYLADNPYKMSNNSNLEDVLSSIIDGNSVHPVKDYLKGLKWDGVERVDTLFIDYQGCEDNDYTRAVTRKSLVGAVARIFEPGVQFDYTLTLIGEEGKRKSSILRKLAKKWFSDTFSFEMLKRGKEAFEQLQGYWIIEIGELTGLRKTEVESVKHFLSKRDDVYRIPHKAFTSQFKRQCIFFGTTNNWDFLQSNNGNRRFWPVPILAQEATKDIARDLTDNEVDQVWAEAVRLYKKGEPLYLSKELELMARENQIGHTEKDDRIGAIEKYLETAVPNDWEDMELQRRREFLHTPDEITATGVRQRSQVSVAEIWCELFGGSFKDMGSQNTKSIHAIMQSLSGWEKTKSTRKFKIYGYQRAYTREISVCAETKAANAK